MNQKIEKLENFVKLIKQSMYEAENCLSTKDYKNFCDDTQIYIAIAEDKITKLKKQNG